MRADPEAAIMHKCRELILLLNIHLNHFPKHEKYGLCQTIRNCVYGVMGLIVDDFILFGLTVDTAKQYRNTITQWLSENLNLELSKWIIQPVKRGVNFVGFRTWRKTRFVRKRSMYNFSKSLKNGKLDSVKSSLSHALNTASHRHFLRQIDEASLCI